MLKDLPAPPVGKKGWPWTKESKSLPPLMPDEKKWPKISIVTPSYNQGQFLEETIRSVLLQNYPNFEYVIMDGGSADNSVEIIKKYEPWLTYWVSERDEGQADAIWKGFESSVGDILAWINSDDYYQPNAFSFVAKKFMKNKAMKLLMGGCVYIRENGVIIVKNYGLKQEYENLLLVGMFSSQPASFWRRTAYIEAGKIDMSLAFCMDYDLVLRMARTNTPYFTIKMLAAYRFHEATKSSRMQNILTEEDMAIGKKYGRFMFPYEFIHKVKKSTWTKYYLKQRINLFLDLFLDPQYFIVSFGNSILEILRIKNKINLFRKKYLF
jgi:glycosyltransferase involved in cell wall biosynthesis